MSERVTYIGIEVPTCTRTYGVSPCTAAIGTTGDIKCFNSKKTCQDRTNYNETKTEHLFSYGTGNADFDVDAIPNITNVNYTPSILALGESIGTRSTLKVTFADHKAPDAVVLHDPYLSSRSYTDTYNRGTFWGKFKARFPYMRGAVLNWYNGRVGEPIVNMEKRTFIIDSMAGPDVSGKFTITAKDPLITLDAKQAQAPRLSNGVLSADITDTANTLTLAPTGIGNLEYPTSGHVAIGGKEIVSFTRSGDVLTITRGQVGTEAQEHSEGDRVQLVLEYSLQTPAAIIHDLMVNYGGVDPLFISLSDWQFEVDNYLGQTYTAKIAEPTAVVDLINEVLQQSAISVWWAERDSKVRLQVMRNVSKSAQKITDDLILANSFSQRDLTDKRVSQVWTYYGQINPLESQDDPTNYRTTLATVSLESEDNYGLPSIKRIYSRWILNANKAAAERLNGLILSRYSEPPRQLSFSLLRDSGAETPALANGYNVETYLTQDATGANSVLPCQAVKVDVNDARWAVTAEEIVITPGFEPPQPETLPILIDSDTNNINLKALFDSLYPEPETNTYTVVCQVAEGVVIGSSSTSNYAFDVGTDWPEGVTIVLTNNGVVAGAGGNGGEAGLFADENGKNGGNALNVTRDVIITNNGIIGGGGGGGGASQAEFWTGSKEPDYGAYAGGGGGGGRIVGVGGTATAPWAGLEDADGSAGTLTNGGVGGTANDNGRIAVGGTGGGLGQAGGTGYVSGSLTDSSVGAGGAAGNAVVGDSLVSWIVLGDIRGARV